MQEKWHKSHKLVAFYKKNPTLHTHYLVLSSDIYNYLFSSSKHELQWKAEPPSHVLQVISQGEQFGAFSS